MNGIAGVQLVTLHIQNLLAEVDPELYGRPLSLYNGSSIGQHVRHILDFYRCLHKNLANALVDYADRERNPQLETDPAYAAQVFREELATLAQLDENQVVKVRGDFAISPQTQRPEYTSSIGRELAFLHDHAVHHLAIIRIGLEQEAPHLIREAHFGVAPSTVKYKMN